MRSRRALAAWAVAVTLLTATPANAFTNRIVNASEQFGVEYTLTNPDDFESTEFSAAGLGDVDGDGLGDVAVDLSNIRPPLDGVFIVPGNRSRVSVRLDDPRTGGYRVRGKEYLSVERAGDFNGDGVGDLLALASEAEARAGVVAVVFGQAQKNPPDVDIGALGARGVRIVGAPGDRVGRDGAASAAGDVNGDGLDDVLVTATRGGTRVGYSAVVFGRTDPGTVRLEDLGSQGFRLDNHCAGPYSADVSGAGDVNGDGLADLLLGTGRPPRSTCPNAGNEVFLVYGKRGAEPIDLRQLGGQGARITGSGIGARVAGGGDFDGDKRPDLLVSLRGGAAVIHRLTPGSSVSIADLGNRATLLNGEDFGYGDVDALGDSNGDGLSDLLTEDLVVFGRRSHRRIELYGVGSGYQVLSAISGAGGYLVGGLAPAGDVNGDGRADVLALPVEYDEAGGYVIWGGGPPLVEANAFATRIGVDRRGRARVGLLCPANTPEFCHGTVVGSSSGRRILRRRFRVGAGHVAKIKAGLPAPIRRRVARGIVVKVRITVTARDARGQKGRTTKVLFLQRRGT